MDRPVSLATVAREWTRLGCLGFGGPPAHITLLRRLCVDDHGWLSPRDFEDAVAVTNMLPGPASTQLAIWCAWRVRGRLGALVGGVCFIAPGLIMILVLSALFLARSPPRWMLGAAAGAGAAVPAVAVAAAAALAPASWQRAGPSRAGHLRWLAYAAAGGTVAATAGPYLVIVLAVCGLLEVSVRPRPHPRRRHPAITTVPAAVTATAATAASGGLGALAWVAFKVGALSYGGGFVIIPLMQRDAVDVYHWMTDGQFLNAVALGQITPGPVVQTVAVVGSAAAGVGGGVLAAAVAFTPSFVVVLAGASRFGRLRANPDVGAFLTGAGAAAIGAIAGAAYPLSLGLSEAWQLAVLALAAGWLLVVRRGVIAALLGAGALGILAAFMGWPIGR
jgi:chromate transporter